MSSRGGASYAALVSSSEEGPPSSPQDEAFFEGDPEVLGSFAFDYGAIIDFRTKQQWAQLVACPVALVVSSLWCWPCFLRRNVAWEAEATHVALTQDGIRYVVDGHPTCCGLWCTDVGRSSKTVPYDKLTDCDLVEPAGTAVCCFVRNTLFEVHVDTASSGGPGTPERPAVHELTIVGLKDPHAFKCAVWSVKRGEPIEDLAVPESLYARHRAPSDLARRADAYDAVVAHGDRGGKRLRGLTKVDFLLADKDYATILLDASRLAQDGRLSQAEVDDLFHRIHAKLTTTASTTEGGGGGGGGPLLA